MAWHAAGQPIVRSAQHANLPTMKLFTKRNSNKIIGNEMCAIRS